MKDLNLKLLEAEKEMKIAIANYEYLKRLSNEQDKSSQDTEFKKQVMLKDVDIEDLRDMLKIANETYINELDNDKKLKLMNHKYEIENAIFNFKINNKIEYADFEKIKNDLLRDAAFLMDLDVLKSYEEKLEQFIKYSDSSYERQIFEKYLKRAEIAISESIDFDASNNVVSENSPEYL